MPLTKKKIKELEKRAIRFRIKKLDGKYLQVIRPRGWKGPRGGKTVGYVIPKSELLARLKKARIMKTLKRLS